MHIDYNERLQGAISSKMLSDISCTFEPDGSRSSSPQPERRSREGRSPSRKSRRHRSAASPTDTGSPDCGSPVPGSHRSAGVTAPDSSDDPFCGIVQFGGAPAKAPADEAV